MLFEKDGRGKIYISDPLPHGEFFASEVLLEVLR
jgi:hypothetical protein